MDTELMRKGFLFFCSRCECELTMENIAYNGSSHTCEGCHMAWMCESDEEYDSELEDIPSTVILGED